jgi:nicotinamide-nucleotide amidase
VQTQEVRASRETASEMQTEKLFLSILIEHTFGGTLSGKVWKTVEIIFTGNELLNGNVLNTNSEWMAKVLTSLGLQVKRMTVIEDNIKVISEALKESLGRNPDYVITSGGLGPTYDDITLEGVAKALGKNLEVNPVALKMIQERYVIAQKAGILRIKDVEKSMEKMAKLPAGSEPLLNPVGAAPGIMIKQGDTTIFSVPGVPVEMKAILTHSIVPRIKATLGRAFHVEKTLIVTGVAEARLGPVVVDTMTRVGNTWIKSCVLGSGRSEICISTTADNEEEANRRVKEASNMIVEGALKAGGKVAEEEKKPVE